MGIQDVGPIAYILTQLEVYDINNCHIYINFPILIFRVKTSSSQDGSDAYQLDDLSVWRFSANGWFDPNVSSLKPFMIKWQSSLKVSAQSDKAFWRS